jgi:hypothetical protein
MPSRDRPSCGVVRHGSLPQQSDAEPGHARGLAQIARAEYALRVVGEFAMAELRRSGQHPKVQEHSSQKR